jgi:DNA-binding NtrC family response regulator
VRRAERIARLQKTITREQVLFDQIARALLEQKWPVEEAVRLVRRSMVRQAVIATGGDVSRAARRLKVHRNAVAQMLDKIRFEALVAEVRACE